MIKKSLFLLILGAVLFLTGCNASTDAGAQNSVQTPKPPENQNHSDSGNIESILPADEWRSYYSNRKNEAINQLFVKARDIVLEQKKLDGELDSWSYHLGQWFIVVIKLAKSDDDMIALDAPTPPNPAYLVDMSSGKMIESGNWKEARPLIEAQIERLKRSFSNNNEKQTFLHHFCSSISAIAFNHTKCLDNPSEYVHYPRPVSGPSYKIKSNSFELVYYFSENGMYVTYTKCTLNVTPNAIMFNSEIVNL